MDEGSTATHAAAAHPGLPSAARGASSSRAAHRAALAALGLGVLLQISYPLLDGAGLRAVTIASVLCLAAASLLHAAAGGLPRAARVLVTVGGLGLLAEAVGVRTGVPFGEYRYTDGLGPQVLGVPLVVPLAWTMTAYPCLLLGRRLSGPGRPVALVGGLALAAWDLFLDPQMVAAGYWVWAHPTPALPGLPGIPLTNYAGWVAVAVLITAALDRVLPADAPNTPDTHDTAPLVPALLLGWTWAGSVVANLAFFDRPAVALYGGVALGLPVVVYLRSLLGEHFRHRGRGGAR